MKEANVDEMAITGITGKPTHRNQKWKSMVMELKRSPDKNVRRITNRPRMELH